jgi:predicted nucleic acid-binding protein
MIVVADTTPLNYLVLIGQIDLLRVLYGQMLIPPAVATELNDLRTPGPVRKWFAQPGEWLQIRAPKHIPANFPDTLGPGEREAIALSQELQADALLLDEWDGRTEAERRHLTVVGTLRVLGDAAEHDLVDLPAALAQLRATNFRASDVLYHPDFAAAREAQARTADRHTTA